MQFVKLATKNVCSTVRNLKLSQISKPFASNASNLTNYKMKPVAYWMFSCAAMSAGAIFLGGVTRLTESGLSMTNWRFIKDMKLPTSNEEWEAEFEQYKKFPEWELLNKERQLDLSQFKFIYFMEYLHRIWGRATGLGFFLPLVYFYPRISANGGFRAITSVGIMATLMGVQGFLGWYMVKSGLEYENLQDNIPRVSPYRLTVHLSTAIILYGFFIWTGLHLLDMKRHRGLPPRPKLLGRLIGLSLVATTLTIISGGFVAGLDAGLVDHQNYRRLEIGSKIHRPLNSITGVTTTP